MRMRIRSMVVVALLLAVAGAVWVGVRRLDRGVAVEVAPVEVGTVRAFIDEEARTRLPRTYLITMPFDGRIRPITVEEGDTVRAGATVAEVMPEDLAAEARAAEAAVARLEAAIRESADTGVERTVLEQARQYVDSMDRTVEAGREQVRASRAKLDFARRELARIGELRARNAATVEELNRYELDAIQADVDYQTDALIARALESVRAATVLLPTVVQQYITRKELRVPVLEQERAEAEARLEQVHLRQTRGTMTSPVDGVVLHRQVRDERHLTAGTTLLEIGRLDELEIEAEVLTQEAVRVEPGQEVIISGAALGAREARGTVRRIDPAGFTEVSSLGVEQQRVNVIVAIDPSDLAQWQARGRIGVGYRVQVRIVTATRADALHIPRTAAFRGADGSWRAAVVRNGRVEIRAIEVGLVNDDVAEVRRGLSAGEQVIPAPDAELVTGTRVQPMAPAAPGAGPP